MKIYSLPDNIRALVFDIDLTLYDNREYYKSQYDLLSRKLAEYRGENLKETQSLINHIREQYKRENNGKTTSMGNIFLAMGISIEQSCAWRTRLFTPEHYLLNDVNLIKTMEVLNRNYSLCAVTNNTKAIASRTLKALGIDAFFPFIIALDDSHVSKPAIKPFRMASQKLHVPLNNMVSLGDRYNVDLEIPLEHGMGGILIEHISDVYALPSILKKKKKS